MKRSTNHILTVSDHPKASSANPKDFFDNRILKELDDTGFVNSMADDKSASYLI
jgi:hypothetical protein